MKDTEIKRTKPVKRASIALRYKFQHIYNWSKRKSREGAERDHLNTE